MTTRSTRIMAAPLALALGAGACIGGGGADVSTLLVSAVTGVVQILRQGGDTEALATGGRIHIGDVIEVGVGGSVALTRGATSALEVKTVRKVNAQLRLDAADRIEVGAGQLLVTSSPDAPLTVGSEGITARGDGVYRFDRSLALRIGVYEGSAVVGAPSGELELERLRQGVIAGRVLPRASDPLQIQPGDEWDQRFLGEVIDLDRTLESHRRGYQAEFGRRMASVVPLETVAGGRSLAFMRPYLSDRDSGDLLIGLVLALLTEEARGARLAVTFRDLMALSDAGASWGLLATEYNIDGRDVIDGVVRAIGLRTGDVRPGTSVTSPPSEGGNGGTPSPEPSPTKTSKPKPSPSPSPSPTEPDPSPSPTPTSTPCVLPPPLCEPPV